MNFDLSHLSSAYYFFDRNPGGDFLIGFVLLGFFILVMFSGSIIRGISENNKYLKKSTRRKFWPFPYLGILGAILVLNRFAMVPFFSMRLFLYIVLFLTVLLLFWAIIKTYWEYSKRVDSSTREKKKRG